MTLPVHANLQSAETLGTGTIDIPISGASIGDHVTLILMNDSLAAGPEFSGNVTGWGFKGTAGDASAAAHIAVYERVIDGTEGTTVTVTCVSSTGIDLKGYSLRSTHADDSMSIHQIQFTVNTQNDNTHEIAAVVTTDPDCLIYFGLSFDGGDGDPFTTSGTGFTELDEYDISTGAGGGSGCVGTRDLASAGSSGIATVTDSSAAGDGSASVMIAITPGAADAVAPDLSLPTSASITSKSVVLGATTNEGNGTAHGIITANGNQSLPTNPEIIDGNAPEELFEPVDLPISGTGAFTFASIAGLDPSTTYGYAIVHADAVGNEDAGSRVEGTFTTAAAPVLTLPTAIQGGGAGGPTDVTVGMTTDTNEGIWYFLASVNAVELYSTIRNTPTGAVTITTSGINTLSFGSWPPDVLLYVHHIHEDAVGGESNIVVASLQTTNYTENEPFSGNQIPSNSILHFAAGNADSGSTTHMIDAGLVSVDDEFNALTIENRTDTTSAVINDSIASTNRVEWLSGTADFTLGNDAYAIVATITLNDTIYIENVVTVSAETFAAIWYLKEFATGLYTKGYTQNYTASGYADGNYNLAIDADGVPTLLAVSDSGVVADEIKRATGIDEITAALSSHYSRTTSESLQDAEFRWLGEQGGTAGTPVDRWIEVFGPGGIEAVKLNYWSSQ